jgi:hypothetical protein
MLLNYMDVMKYILWNGKMYSICLTLIFFTFGVIAQPETPSGLTLESYDSHIELSWFKNAEPNLSTYRIYRSEDGLNFDQIKIVSSSNNSYIDFVGRFDKSYTYKITAVNNIAEESGFSSAIAGSTFEMTDEEMLTMVQEYTFRYFWDFAHPVSGLARERNTTSIVTSGGSGFGVMAILVGMHRGFVSHEDGVDRLLKIVRFLENADRFHGVFPHWMNGATGEVIPFSQFDNGGDLVETAFLIQGLLTVRQCISGESTKEVELREKITKIWEEVDWNWYRKTVQTVLYWHWSPEFLWQLNHQIRGFNEAHIIYILAISSPTHPVPASLYHSGWAAGNYTNGNSYYGYPLEVGQPRGGPLFFSHYSYLGFDPRNKKDDYTNYFERNKNHTLINREYCIDNPQNYEGYSEDSWGLTASDDPFGYLAHEPSPNRDNGTISPTAAISSMPFTPDLSIAAMKHFYRNLGDKIWGEYGFFDAFNIRENWYAKSFLAIDQGPIIGMIENYRSQLLWDCFMSNEEILIGLDAIGFEPDSSIVSLDDLPDQNFDFKVYPNPATEKVDILFSLKEKSTVSIDLLDIYGKRIKRVKNKDVLSPGINIETLDVSDLLSGAYVLRLKSNIEFKTKIIRVMH